MVGLAITGATIISVSLQLDEYMTTVPALNLPPMELTVLAAQTATAVKEQQTAIYSTAIAMNIPTLSPTPGLRETQYIVLEKTVKAENIVSDPTSVRASVVARQLVLPTVTEDKVAIAAEIERVSSGLNAHLDVAFGGLTIALIVIVAVIIYPFIGISSIISSLRKLLNKHNSSGAGPERKNTST